MQVAVHAMSWGPIKGTSTEGSPTSCLGLYHESEYFKKELSLLGKPILGKGEIYNLDKFEGI